MFQTKQQVDRHVESSLKKVNNETERNLRCFSFAKLYFQVGDYEQAVRYLTSYLSAKPKAPEAHQLMGKALEKLGRKTAALDAYRTSLQLDPKQNNLVIKVCELLSSDEVVMDKLGARYYCDLAQNFDPHNTAVLSLRERLITTENEDPETISNLLLKELENRPMDVNLRVKLLKHFIQHNLIKEAYKHASDIENKTMEIFQNKLSWYETFADVLIRYQREQSGLDWNFLVLSVSVLDRLVSLSLDEHVEGSTTVDYVDALFNFDQMLSKASGFKEGNDRQLSAEFYNHYQAQLHFHLATVLYKQAKKDLIQFKDAVNVSLPVLFSSYHSQPCDLQSMHYIQTSESNRRLLQRWHREAAYRCSQSGHILLAVAKDRKSYILEKAAQFSTGMWREQLFKKVFVKRDQQLKMKSSYFINCSQTETDLKLPDPSDLLKLDQTSLLLNPDSLHHYIWVCLNYVPKDLHKLTFPTFEGLQLSVKNFNNCAAESLSLLDIEAFVFCATICAKAKLDEKQFQGFYKDHKDKRPGVLPAAITDNLASLAQSKFLTAAYKMYKNIHGSNMSELRLVLIKGIEAVRCVGHHGLEVRILINLAEVFAERAKKLSKLSEIEAVTARANLYWTTALPLLEKIKANQMIAYNSNRLFDSKSKELSIIEAAVNIDKAKLFIAVQLMKKKEYEKALPMLEALKDPYASYYQSQIYKHMADQKTNQNKENVTSEMRSQNIILLSRARDCLYLTLDRLREPSIDPGHPLNAQLGTEIEKMERLLSRIDPDCANRNECDGMSDENVSSDSVDTHYYTSNNISSFTPKLNNSVRFRREARPSPERLDAQLRQLAATKDAAISSIIEQNKLMVESQKSLIDELRSFTATVNNLTSTVGDLKEELKSSIDSFKNLEDVVYEMKKEISELKKDKNQLSDEDLYVLDPEYTDFNINANNQQFNQQVYPGYQNRLSGSYAPPLYPNLYPGLAAYGYGNPVLPPAGAMPFVDQQQLVGGYNQGIAQHNNSLLGGQNLAQSALTPVSKSLSTVTSTTQSLFSTMSPAASAAPVTTKSAPVNVVITASDPLPSLKTTAPQPVLSVVIPPQHIKGGQAKPQTQPQPQPHSYQIPLPASGSLVTSAPAILSQPPPAISTQSLLSNVAPPVFSAVASKTPTKNLSFGAGDSLAEESKVSNLSSSSVEEHDACPDFKPIIPLPDEVPVNTGEEKETVLFCERAKLFRHVDKEWKERGVGNLKLLLNPETGKVRLLMRRDQVHKICANHFLTKDLVLTPMPNNDRAYIWAAPDFSEEAVVVEKFCVRFKTAEEAKKFYASFEDAKKKLSESKPSENKPAPIATSKVEVSSKPTQIQASTPKNSTALGGFTFSSTPVFKPKETEPIAAVSVAVSETKPTPFAGFSFSSPAAKPLEPKTFSPSVVSSSVSKADDDVVDDFVPTAEFKPVVALPDLVEVKTGEENAEVLFEARAKLFRYDTDGETNEWKERGIGVIKILREGALRLVMRRDQVHKVCLNHQVPKNMTFKLNTNNQKAVVWHAQDFSEGFLKAETFTARFKTEELAQEFLNVLKEAQENLDESSKHQKTENLPETGYGDKFKPAKGSWECKNCYIFNEGKDSKCQACDTPKSGSSKDDKSGPVFSFGSSSAISFAQKDKEKPVGFGDAFAPKKDSWECKACMVRNDGTASNCAACQAGKDGTAPKNEPKGIDLSTGGQKFVFGIKPSTTATPVSSTSTPTLFGNSTTATKPGFGDAFAPKKDSWECKLCYVRNRPNTLHCVSCQTPKDDTVPKKENEPKGVDLSTGGLKFTFGIATTSATPMTSTVTFSSGKSTPKFAFGSDAAAPTFSFTPKATTTTSSSFSFTPKSSGFSFNTPTTTTSSGSTLTPNVPAKFVFGSPNKHEFEFTPKSPRKISSGNADEESDGSYVEEEADNIYFKPVIPLPDKVEVKTGEEDEDVLYCHRAKLFRFVDKEWKERGLGDIKILKSKASGKLRVVMRREQVLKICLNHVLTKEIEYLKKDDKCWMFHAADFSEGEIRHEQFCVKFKTPEIAQEFKKAVEAALSGGGGKVESEEDEVEFVSETKVSSEDEKEAKKLGLPAKFMAYKQLPDCECNQCKKDDEYLKDLISDKLEPVKNLTQETSSNLTKETSSPQLKELLAKPKINLFATTPGDVKNKSVSFSFTAAAAASGSTTSTAPTTSIFGSGSIFATANNTPPTSGIFGGTSTATSTPNLFGGKTSIFGTPSQSSTGTSIFGTPNPSTSSLFGTPNTTTNTGSSLFGTAAASTSSTASIFGNSSFASTTSIFETKPVIFGKVAEEGSKGPLANEPKGQSANLKEDDEVVLKCDSGLSFASLANKSDNVFGKQPTATSASNFSFLGAGAPVFASLKTKEDSVSKDNQEEEEGHEQSHNDEEYDPHYEPIVPLPDAIEVTTGEENEDIVFNERAKLYRFVDASKEWKERGVGQLKILFHPVNKTYRLLLRREQVHKVVLNQLIVYDLEMNRMATSEKAWMWAGYNYTDDDKGIEKLAVKFKNEELGKKFHETIELVKCKVIEFNNQKLSQIPTTVTEVKQEEEEHDEEDDDDYGEERTILISKKAVLSTQIEGTSDYKDIGKGNLVIYYDSDSYAARIELTDQSENEISNTVIGTNTVMENDKNCCYWKGVEWAEGLLEWRTLKATFDTEKDAEEFYATYLEGLHYAEEFGIVDDIPHRSEEETDE